MSLYMITDETLRVPTKKIESTWHRCCWIPSLSTAGHIHTMKRTLPIILGRKMILLWQRFGIFLYFFYLFFRFIKLASRIFAIKIDGLSSSFRTAGLSDMGKIRVETGLALTPSPPLASEKSWYWCWNTCSYSTFTVFIMVEDCFMRPEISQQFAIKYEPHRLGRNLTPHRKLHSIWHLNIPRFIHWSKIENVCTGKST